MTIFMPTQTAKYNCSKRLIVLSALVSKGQVLFLSLQKTFSKKVRAILSWVHNFFRFILSVCSHMS
jgi:hypothetical protein